MAADTAPPAAAAWFRKACPAKVAAEGCGVTSALSGEASCRNVFQEAFGGGLMVAAEVGDPMWKCSGLGKGNCGMAGSGVCGAGVLGTLTSTPFRPGVLGTLSPGPTRPR